VTTTVVYSDESGTYDDGYVQSTGAPYSPAREGTGTLAASPDSSAISMGQYYPGFAPYYVWQGFCAFDTSAVGGDTVDSVAFAIYGQSDVSITDFTLEARSHTWAPLATGDFVAGSSLSSKTLLATFATSGFSTSAYNTFTESGTAFRSAINGAGYTEFLVASDRQRVGNTPAGGEYVNSYAAERSGTTEDPKLTVVHTAAAGLTPRSYPRGVARGMRRGII